MLDPKGRAFCCVSCSLKDSWIGFLFFCLFIHFLWKDKNHENRKKCLPSSAFSSFCITKLEEKNKPKRWENLLDKLRITPDRDLSFRWVCLSSFFPPEVIKTTIARCTFKVYTILATKLLLGPLSIARGKKVHIARAYLI